eukprot:3844808-Amphidinium_carterae.1
MNGLSWLIWRGGPQLQSKPFRLLPVLGPRPSTAQAAGAALESTMSQAASAAPLANLLEST